MNRENGRARLKSPLVNAKEIGMNLSVLLNRTEVKCMRDCYY